MAKEKVSEGSTGVKWWDEETDVIVAGGGHSGIAAAVQASELEARIRRLEDIDEIRRLQSRYQHFLHMYNWEAIEDMFATDTPDVTIEIDNSGVYEGTAGVKRMFERIASARKGRKGTLLLHTAINPVIEVSKDGKTAKGLWHSPFLAVATEQGKPSAAIGVGKYGMDYVKEDGKWKF